MIPDELMRAIIANKSDDLPRLIAADWLDEHGDSERSEFIRVQCELAKFGESFPLRCAKTATMTSYGNYTKHCKCMVCRWRRKEYYSSRRYIVWDWAGGVDGGYVHMVNYDGWSRGFVSTITCTWQDWLTHADAILKATPLEVVRLTDRPDYYNEPSPELFDHLWPGIRFELPQQLTARRFPAAIPIFPGLTAQEKPPA